VPYYQGQLTFIPSPYRKLQITLSLSLATFCRPNSLFAFYSLQHHAHIHHRRDYDEQKVVVVVKHHYQGCQSNTKCAGTHNISKAQITGLCSSAAYN